MNLVTTEQIYHKQQKLMEGNQKFQTRNIWKITYYKTTGCNKYDWAIYGDLGVQRPRPLSYVNNPGLSTTHAIYAFKFHIVLCEHFQLIYQWELKQL